MYFNAPRSIKGTALTSANPQRSSTLSVIGVGVTLAVCLNGAKIEKIAFWGHVISTLLKLGEMLEALQFDLRTKFGPLSALQLTLRCQKNFVFGG